MDHLRDSQKSYIIGELQVLCESLLLGLCTQCIICRCDIVIIYMYVLFNCTVNTCYVVGLPIKIFYSILFYKYLISFFGLTDMTEAVTKSGSNTENFVYH